MRQFPVVVVSLFVIFYFSLQLQQRTTESVKMLLDHSELEVNRQIKVKRLR
jgi:preprotein translocase subunit YajC